jgi:alpha-D-ribose 1-methylphosphonate 5-triphosphate synthase subunit PhnI
MTTTSSATNAQRIRDYRQRLRAAGKKEVRLVIHEKVARQLHDLARSRVMSQSDILVKALAALQEEEAPATPDDQ